MSSSSSGVGDSTGGGPDGPTVSFLSFSLTFPYGQQVEDVLSVALLAIFPMYNMRMGCAKIGESVAAIQHARCGRVLSVARFGSFPP